MSQAKFNASSRAGGAEGTVHLLLLIPTPTAVGAILSLDPFQFFLLDISKTNPSNDLPPFIAYPHPHCVFNEMDFMRSFETNAMVLQNYQNFIEMNSNMIYIVALGNFRISVVSVLLVINMRQKKH